MQLLKEKIQGLSFFLVIISPIKVYGFEKSRNIIDDSDGPFIVTPLVTRQVQFWEKIFFIFPSSTTIIHDVDDPDLIIQIIDHEQTQKKINENRQVTSIKQFAENETMNILKNLSNGVKKLKKSYPMVTPVNDAERRIASIYLRHARSRDKFKKNPPRFRAQSGLSDTFQKAAYIGKKYLPMMEAIFSAHNLPPSLSNLVFVESMFNTEAKSKVGASGIWQFMPQTAKKFLFITEQIDERNSPIKATKAAAQLLYKNYLILKSWPHAITAYNHGTRGMQAAMTKLNSTNFDDVIKYHQGATFGFASKNFYSEFIAAKRIYEQHYAQLKPSNTEDQEEVVSTVIPRSTTIPEISELIGLSIDDILKFNPCIIPKIQYQSPRDRLPPFFEIFGPEKNITYLSNKLNLQKVIPRDPS